MRPAARNIRGSDYTGLLTLRGQTHVVVGVGEGIGSETAHALADAGASVVCVDLDHEQAARVAAAVGGVSAACDVTEPGAFGRVLSDAIARTGQLDGVVDVVGLVRWQSLDEASDEDWDWQDAIVAAQALRVLRAATPQLAASGGGSLTYVASVSALASAPGHGLYGMSKAALLSLVRTSAVELGPLKIRVNAVSPGATLTPRLASDPRFALANEKNASRTPLGRLAHPGDIAAAVLFLSSGLAAHVTGQNLIVDGGLSITWPLERPDPR